MTMYRRSLAHLVLVDGNDEQLLERLHLDQSVAEALAQLHVNQLQVLQRVRGREDRRFNAFASQLYSNPDSSGGQVGVCT